MTVISENALKLLKEKEYFKQNESSWEDICLRVSKAIASAEETKEKQKEVQKQVYDAMSKLDFLFSTPCLINADETNCGQLSSCFVAETRDNIDDICKMDAEFAKIFQRNGGVGSDLSVLRPALSPVETSNGYAGGIISFMRKYDATADEMTKNNAARKGAIKINLQCWHPQIQEFIHCKDDLNQLNKMNISISFTDAFMKALENDENWNLEFPDYSSNKEIYDAEWDGNLDKWKSKGYPVKIHKTLKAKDLFMEFCESSWKTGEPGLNFQDRMNLDNVNKHLSENVYTNPCSEFTNIPYSSCNLGSINLLNCVVNGKFDFNKLRSLVKNATRWLDNMITINKLPLDKIDKVTKLIRPIGLGFMGLADVFYTLNIPYNSQTAYDLAEKIISTMREHSVNTSIELAEEKGEYIAWVGSDWEKRNIKIRNCNHISIAPTGTISFIAGVSGGCEPNFGLCYSRRTYDGNLYYVVNPIFEERLKYLGIYSDDLMSKIVKNHGSCKGIKEIPKDIQDVFVTAHDILPNEHVEMVSVLQKHVDLSLSKTVNFSNNATVNDIIDIYIQSHKKGLKGLSIYRDGSRENQTLSTSRDVKEELPKPSIQFDYISPLSKDDLGETYGSSIKKKVACGNLYIQLFRDSNGNLAEVFINTSKGGVCQSNINAISRLISLSLRGGIKVESICEQIANIKCPACSILRSKGENIEASCADAIGKYILEKYSQGEITIKEHKSKNKPKTKSKDSKNQCPNCGEKMRMESGCIVCTCGFSKCG